MLPSALLPFFAAAPAFAQSPALTKQIRSCSSTVCHGATTPGNSDTINFNEYYVWTKKDLHARAGAALDNDLSKKIARRLSLKDPAKEPLCLSCHVGTVVHGDKVIPVSETGDAGFQCVSCHGAEGSWIQNHTSEEASHAKNVADGMRDLLPLDKRAALCATCHIGSGKGDVNHKLLSGGHPRLTFELDTFTHLMPPHWQVDDDYVQRKGSYSSIAAWINGQYSLAVASVERIKRLGLGKKSLIPEASLFYCAACHHSIASNDWRADNVSPQLGKLRLNIAHLRMLGVILEASSPPLAMKFKSALGSVLSDFPKDSTGPKIDNLLNLMRGEIAANIRSIRIDARFAASMYAGLEAFSARKGEFRFEDAEQVVMGFQSIIYSPYKPKNADESRLKLLRNLMANPRQFSSGKLGEAVYGIKAAGDESKTRR